MFKTKGEIKREYMQTLTEAQVAKPTPVSPPGPEPAAGEKRQRPRKRRPAHLVLIACAVVLLLLGTAYGIFLGQWEGGSIATDELTSLSITLNINSQPELLLTNAATVGELLQEQRILLRAEDYIGLDIEQPLSEGMKIWLRLSVPISVIADGETILLESQPITVREALALAGVSLDEDDECSLPLLQYIYQPTSIRVYRISTERETVDEAVPPPEVEQEFTYLTPGSREVISPGRDGLQRNTYDVTYRDGEETHRVLVESRRISDPGDKIIGYGPELSELVEVSAGGAARKTATTESGASFYYREVFEIETTAYTWTGNRTASGAWPKVGTIAVDPGVIPMGTKAYIVGYGFATAEDTGGAIKGNIVDLYMDTETECLNWGRRDVVIYILGD